MIVASYKVTPSQVRILSSPFKIRTKISGPGGKKKLINRVDVVAGLRVDNQKTEQM